MVNASAGNCFPTRKVTLNYMDPNSPDDTTAGNNITT